MKKLSDRQIDTIISLHQEGKRSTDIASRLKVPTSEVRQIEVILKSFNKLKPTKHADKHNLMQLLPDDTEITQPARRVSWLLPLAGLVSFALVAALVILAPDQKDSTTGFTPSQLTANGTPDHANNTIQAASLAEQSVAGEELGDINLVSVDSEAIKKIGDSYGEDNF